MPLRATVVFFALAFLVSCGLPDERAAGPAPASQPAPTEIDRGPGAVPNRWFYGQRVGKSGTIPFRARSRALAASRQQGLVDAPGNWINVGPFNVGGRVTAIAADPNQPQAFWVGTAAGGVFLTEDGGTTFTPVFDDQVALSIGTIVAHPTDSNTVYVGTGEDNGGGLSYDGEGVFKTTDRGATWQSMGLAEVRRIGKMAVDPTDGDRVYAAAGGDWFQPGPDRGVYRTLNGGDTWEQVLFVGEDAGACEVVVHPTNPNLVVASIWQRLSLGDDWYIGGGLGGIYRSLDGGDTWTELTNGLPALPGRIGLAFAPTEPDWIYANIIDRFGRLDGIYRSEDAGDTWTKRSSTSVPAQFTPYSYYFSQIRVDPLDADVIYALDLRLNKSIDGGATFFRVANVVHVDWHELIVEPGGRMVAGTDGGFYTSPNFGNSWFHSEALPITQFYDLGIDTLNPERRFAGAQDNGTVRTTDAGVSNWTNVFGGDGLQTEVDYTNSQKVYASAQNGYLARSVNGGDSFMLSTAGIADERTHWNAPYIIDPIEPTRLYTATYRVYVSTDSAVNWSPISPDLTNGPTPATFNDVHDDEHGDDRGDGHDDHEHAGREAATGRESKNLGQTHLENLIRGTITVVHVSPADFFVIWVGTDDGNVWVTENGGGQWSQVNPPGLAYWVTDIAADPTDRRSAYLTVTGYREGDDTPYVRATDDLGTTWRDATGNLPQVPTNSILIDRTWKERVFVGNDLGVYVSDNRGASWSAMRGSMPYVVIADLVLHESTNTLYAGSFARSVFTFDLAQLPEADGDGDGSDNNTDCAPLDPGAITAPPEVRDLVLDRGPAGESLLAWYDPRDTAGSGTIFDVLAGSLTDLRGSGTVTGGDLQCDVADVQTQDAAVPPEGEALYYLVRARNVCAAGSWGAGSAGDPHEPPGCP